MPNREQLIVALDFPSREEALTLAGKVWSEATWFKVGLELFTAAGEAVVDSLKEMGARVFLDLKLHDIPNTVAGAAAAATRLGVDMLTVHALGGKEMMAAAVAAVQEEAGKRGIPVPLVVAVTILTTTDQQVLHRELGIPAAMEEQVLRLANLARAAGADGVVASPLEVATLRRELGPDFCLVTPGIRPAGTAAHDQRRILTPGAAVAAGSNYLVVGRPITRAADPAAAARDIRREMEEV